MSQLEVDKIIPQSGTTLTLGDTGDTINFGSGVLPNFENLTVTGDFTVDTNSLKVDSTNNRVGIGTASPSVALDVVGAITASGNITGTLATAAQPNITSVGTLTSFASTGIDDNATSTAITIDSSERVGIGETNPDKQLEISSSTGGTLQLTNSSTSIGAGESLGEITFFSNDASGDGTGVRGFIKSVENDGGTGRRYDLTFGTGNRATATEKLRIDKDGKVGIGTTSPLSTLHVDTSDSGVTPSVNADDLFVESSGSTGITIGSGTANFGRINFGDSGDANIGIIQYEHTTNAFAFTTNASERMRIDSSGKVGINNSAPSTELEVYGTIKAHEKSGLAQASILIDALATGNPHLAFQQAGAYKGYIHYLDASDTICLNDGSGNGLHYSPSQQKLGIGTSSPSSYYANHLVVDIGSTAQSGITIVADSSNQAMLAFADGTSGDTRYRGYLDYNHSNDSLAFASAGTERMRIDSNGSVLIGTASEPTGSTGGAGFISDNAGRKNLICATTSTGNFELIEFRNPNGTVGTIRTSGSNTSFNTSSDYRLKENIVEIENATARLKELKPKRFNFIADADTTVDGFLAHEVSDIVPEAIHGTKDAVDEDGNPQYQGIDQSKLVPLLVKTIQELEARITTLENA